MYKTKLQELCHQRSWSLPEYNTIKEGPSHSSRFQASVNVNGLAFSSSAPARSSKLAQNDAAFVALTHFSSPAATTLVNELNSGEGTATQQNAPVISQTLLTATPQNAPEISQTLQITTPQNGPEINPILQTTTQQNAPEISQTLQIATPQSAPEISQTLQTSTQQNVLESSQTLHSLGTGVVADVGGLTGVGVAFNVDGIRGNSPLITAPETNQILENKGISVAESGGTLIGDESFTVTNELNNCGLTTKNALGVSQTQESGVVAIKNGHIYLGSSTVIKELNSSGPSTQTAVETCQAQGSGVFAIANNDNSSTGKTPQLKGPETNLTMGSKSIVAATVDNNFMGMHHLSKTQLQCYTQKRHLSLPLYSVECEGPPHACRFRCNVIVDGKTYESREFYPTLNKAEAAAARIALMSLLPNGVEQDESRYKNLLQELVHKMGHQLPTYITSKSGQDHVPTFVSEVKIGEECFMGQEARNKKQAESSAAKVAYTTLKQRNLQAEETSHAPSVQGGFEGKSGPSHATQQLVSHKRPDLAGSQNENLPPSPKRQEVQLSSSSMNRADYIAYLQQNVQPSMPIPEKQVEVFPVLDLSSPSRSVSSTSGTSFSSTSEQSQSLTAFASNSSSSSTIRASIEHLVKASKTCKIGVVVHPRQSNISYPPGSNVLPISSDDWVAVKFTSDSSD